MNTRELTCLGLGAMAGVAVAVLFAPKSGAETREFLCSEAEGGIEFVRTGAGEMLDAASQAVECGTKAVRQHAENVTVAVAAGMDTYREALRSTP